MDKGGRGVPRPHTGPGRYLSVAAYVQKVSQRKTRDASDLYNVLLTHKNL